MSVDVQEHSEQLDDYPGFRPSKSSVDEWIIALAQGKTPQGNRNFKVILTENDSGNMIVPYDIAKSEKPSLFVEYAGEKPRIKKSGQNYFDLQADHSIVYVANVNGDKFTLIASNNRLLANTNGPELIGRKVHICGTELCRQYETLVAQNHPKKGVVTATNEQTISKLAKSLNIDTPIAQKFLQTVGDQDIALRGVGWLCYALQQVTREEIMFLTSVELASKGVRLPSDKAKRKAIIQAAKLAAKL